MAYEISALNIGGQKYDIIAEKVTTAASASVWEGISAKVGSQLTSVYRVKGSCTTAALPTSAVVGDVWNITGTSGTIDGQDVYSGDNLVYTSWGWDKLGASIDTSHFVPDSRKVNGKALTSDVTIGISDISNLSTYTAYAKDWNDNKSKYATTASLETTNSAVSTLQGYFTNGSAKSADKATSAANAGNAAKLGNVDAASVTGSANSGAAASAYIKSRESYWTNNNDYSKVAVYATEGASAMITNATKVGDMFGLSAWGSDVKLVATATTDGHPIIGISAKNSETTLKNVYGIIETQTGTITAASTQDKFKITGSNGIQVTAANGAANADVITVKAVDATPETATNKTKGVTYASYVKDSVAYIY